MPSHGDIWKPNVVVASVVERDGRFLVVEERDEEGRLVINQPAGHLDRGETLIAAARRETLEETAWHTEPLAIIGIYTYPRPGTDIVYMRCCYHSRALRHEPDRPLDYPVERVCWYTREELLERRPMHRSPLVMRCIEDYLAGRRFPLDLIQHC
ncbi:MAG: NUDIX hydrolase [Gammaproteobacteria bacterium]